MQTLWQDLRFGLRLLGKHAGFTAVAVLTLALGVGVNSAVFSIVNAYLFRPLAVKDPNQLVAMGTRDATLEVPYEVSYPNYQDLRDRTDVFSDVIAFQNAVANVNAGGQPERTWLEAVTGNYFSMLGVEAAVGRTFSAEEGRLPGGDPVAVIGYSYWQRRFGGDPAIVGKTIRLNGLDLTIVGVAPPEFKGTETMLALDVYVPLAINERLYPRIGGWWTQREDTGLRVLGRLKPGVSIDQARVAVDLLARQLEQEYPATNKGMSFAVEFEAHSRPVISVAEWVPRISAVFMALVSLVLLIACANVANLMLARTSARQKEIAIRAALGASRARVIRLLLTESMVVGIAGGAVGLLLSFWAIDWLSSIRLSTDAPIRFELAPDWRVLSFAAVIAVLTGVISGVVPAIQASTPNVSEALKEGGRRSASPTRQRVRGALVVAQVAVSMVVLISAGLFVQSARRAEKMDMGFRPDNLAMVSMDLEAQGYDEARGLRFYKQLTERVRALPGVVDADIARNTPLGYSNNSQDIYFEGRAAAKPEEDHVSFFFNIVGPDYFKTMGTAILEGREFSPSDNESSPAVAIVNETMARRNWPGENAIGKRFAFKREGPYLQVVGVARDSKYIFLGEEPRSFFFTPFEQSYRPEMTLFFHGKGDANALVAAVTQVVRELDPDLPVYDAKTMTSHLRDGLALLFVRLGAQIATTFGLLGLALAVVGVYGVVSYSVSQRVHEIGVRVALGAQGLDVLRLVIGQGLLLTTLGVAIGLAAAIAMTRVMTSLLYGVSATDPLTFLAVGFLLTGVALAASFIPARRALKVDPMSALRCE